MTSRKNFSETHGRAILPGQVWEIPYSVTGLAEHTEIKKIRVMAVAEGYVMCRRPGAMPFVMAVTQLSDWKMPPRPEIGKCS